MPLQPPGIPSFPARYPAQLADFNTWLRDPFSFLVAPPVLRVRLASPQAIPSGTWTVLQFANVDDDTYSGWVTTGSSPNYRYTPQAPGWYLVTVRVAANAAAAASTHALMPGIIQTGFRYEANEAWQVTADTAGLVSTQQLVYCVPGVDYIQGAINILSAALNTPSTAGQQCLMDINWVSA
jgi:hypothetical protein